MAPSAGVERRHRISSHISESMKDLSCWKVSQNPARGLRPAHPNTSLLRKSQSSQAALAPQEYKVFLKKAYSTAFCFKMLRDLHDSDPSRLKYIVKKIKDMADGAPSLVLEAIHDYFVDNPQMSTQHRFWLFHVLEAVIGASDSLEQTWEEIFMNLALENMSKSTELEDVYQDAASHVLLAICKHSSRAVAQRLETEVLTGVFPHRSRLYVMGVLTADQELLSQGERACWEEQLTQIAVKSVQFLNTDVWSKELLWTLTKPDPMHHGQPPEKAFLFVYYGLILQAEENGTTVRTHLLALLETSHQWPKQREGIALTVGLAAARHLDDAWAALEQFGRSAPIKGNLHSVSPKTSQDLRWKWASSTVLLAYGQMAVKAKAYILPWVDNILSRMTFYFHCGSWDETLKQSFLAATLMLVGAISRNEGAHSYGFSQLTELFKCLMVLLEKEPWAALCTSTRQQTIHAISSLCKLRPPLDSEKKSRLLATCLRSVLALPPLDKLEKHTCFSLELPDVQALYSKTSEALDQLLQTLITQNPTADELHALLSHLHIWLASEKAHERQRAVHSCTALLRFLNHSRYLGPTEDFKQIGRLVGMLALLCQDPDGATQCSSLEGLGHLYQLLLRHRASSKAEALAPKQLSQASEDRALLWSSRHPKATLPTLREVPLPKDCIFQLGSSQVIKEVMKHLTAAELTDVTWTATDGLGSARPYCVQAAASVLLTAIQEHGAKLETVASLGRAIHLQICSVRIPQAKKNALRAITLLARNHTPELAATFLDSSMALDSRAFLVWRALGAEQPASRLVLAVLLARLQERPLPLGARDGSPPPMDKARLRALAAMNTLLELQITREFKTAMQEAYPQLLLALLTQTYYILELNLPKGPQQGQEAQEVATPSPQSTSLGTLKSLLSTTGHWQDFALLELQGAWELFLTMDTYPQGVSLLARAMVQSRCRQIRGVLPQLLPALRSQEEPERKVAILFLTEFLYSPALLEVLSKQDVLTALAQSLRDPSPEVRVLSLQGLGNILFHPEKGSLLRGQLRLFLQAFQKSEPVVLRVLRTVSDVLQRLGPYGVGAQSLGIARNARSFFDDESDRIRAAAMALFGDLVAAMAGREPSSLRTQVHQGMVPLLLHLRDRCPAVVMQAKFAFYRCAVLLRWPLRHTLFCSLAWERGLSARHFLWTSLMTHSQKKFSIHLTQALSYLHSHHHHIKTWAALFLGYTICYYHQAVSQVVNDMDTKLLFSTFEDLKKDPEPGIREFATKQFSFLQEVTARLR